MADYRLLSNSEEGQNYQKKLPSLPRLWPEDVLVREYISLCQVKLAQSIEESQCFLRELFEFYFSPKKKMAFELRI